MHDHKQIVSSPRFKDVYLPELFEFLSDDDSLIKVDAIETFSEILEELTKDVIEEFLQVFLKYLVCDPDE